jgi:SHO1 osmosensor
MNKIPGLSSKQPKQPSNSSYSSLSYNVVIVATITVTAISWIIAFSGSIASSQTIEFFPKFTWWGLVFELFVVIGIPVLYFANLLEFYRSFLLAVVTIAFIYTSNSTNNLVYYTDSSSSAAGTGFILLSISNFFWLIYLGSDSNAPLIAFINRYGGPNSTSQISRKRISSMGNDQRETYSYTRGTQSTANLNNNNNFDDLYSNMEGAHELAGFENPVSTTNSTHQSRQYQLGNNNNLSDLEFNDSAYRTSGVLPSSSNNNNLNNNEGTNFTGISSVTAYMEAYPILVRGLYDYNASPDDVNELSFRKGEVFRVKNTNGNWWQGKNKRGEIGMCPSNYLEIVT